MGVVALTEHGVRRVRERLGLKRKAVARAVETAWARGVPSRDLRRAVGDQMTTRVWRGAVFVFSTGGVVPALVTVLPEKVLEDDLAGYRSRRFFLEQRAERKQRRRGRRGSGGKPWLSSMQRARTEPEWSR